MQIYGSLWTQTYFWLSTKPEFLVAKDEILAALVTVSVATSSLFNNLYNQILWMDNRCWWNVRTSCPIKMWNWPDIFKIWSDNVRWPTVIPSPAGGLTRLLPFAPWQLCFYGDLDYEWSLFHLVHLAWRIKARGKNFMQAFFSSRFTYGQLSERGILLV